jgi:Uma2 family endonuclease
VVSAALKLSVDPVARPRAAPAHPGARPRAAPAHPGARPRAAPAHPGARPRAAPDPTYYPVVDKMGEGSLQRLIAELLRPLLAYALAERGFKAFTGADQFIYYQQHAPTESCAPDVYVMPGLEPELDVDCWKIWEEPRAVPSFAFEIVSRNNPRKDTAHSPVRHATLGTKELIIFDPRRPRAPTPGRPPPKTDRTRWMVFRRLPRRGLIQVEGHDADRVYSKSLKLWLRVVGEGAQMRVRVARGPEGDELIPTPVEREERERSARQAAEAEVARLRAELDRLRR